MLALSPCVLITSSASRRLSLGLGVLATRLTSLSIKRHFSDIGIIPISCTT